ncbi:unnamed protein product, partial [Allacma fusca]
RLVFQDAELTGKSLFGRQCNANKLLKLLHVGSRGRLQKVWS